MIKTIAFLVLVTGLFAGCNKKSSDNGTVVEYQVTGVNASNIAVVYNNVLQEKVQVNAQSGWVFDVTITDKPFLAYLQASSTSPTSTVQTTCTVNILVNGSIVKTATMSSGTTAVAEAQYTVQ